MIRTYKPLAADPSDWFSAEEVDKARRYQRPLSRASILAGVVQAAVVLAVIASHAVPRLLEVAGMPPWPVQVVLTVALLVVVLLPFELPFAVWTTFVHEQRWGFNTQTPKGFVIDTVKELLMSVVLLSALLGAVFAVIRATELWWVWAWAVVFAFSVVLGMLYPILIAPIFNKFRPLADEALATRLRELAGRAKLQVSEVLVMDASTRTRKDNAYFAGLGKTRRVVLFDNLLEQPPESVEVVVAHEMGHWRRRHIAKSLPVSAVLTFVMFYVIQAILSWQPALDLAGVESVREPAIIPLFMAVFVAFNMTTAVIQAWMSRAFERQADIDALELTGDPEAFRTMQRSLHTKNLADLAPSRWKYLRASHPPAAERLELSRVWERQQTPT